MRVDAPDWLQRAVSTHLLRLDGRGVVLAANGAAARGLGVSALDLIGTPLADLLVQGQAEAPSTSEDGVTLLTFAAGDERYTLACRSWPADDGTWLIGERPAADALLDGELLRMNNELAVLARSYASQATALQRAIVEREAVRGTLASLGEMLSICMSCGDLGTREGAGWADAAAFLTTHGIELSHGYCPACGEIALAAAGIVRA